MYKVQITETLQRIVEVEAENEIEAQDKVEQMYCDADIILDADDMKGVAEFEVIE